MKITNGNSKLSIAIPNINLPAGITCRPDAPCCKGCYAKHGAFLYKNVQQSYYDNLKDYINDSTKYFEDIINQLTNPLTIYRYCRWHSSGDIVDYQYLLGMVHVAEECKDTNFLAFTKKYELVNQYLDENESLPDNLHIVFSGWDASWTFGNRHHLPVALVRFKNDERDFSAYTKCNGKCYECMQCWKLKKNETIYFDKH